MGHTWPLFVYFLPFAYTMSNVVQKFDNINPSMVYLGFELGTAGW